jgi:hypothetical protein
VPRSARPSGARLHRPQVRRAARGHGGRRR